MISADLIYPNDPASGAKASASVATRPTNPRISATIASDFEALKNDVEQAKELAAEYQRQLAGKSNEFAELKRLFEKTQADLISLQASVSDLRIERHRLANEVMKCEGMDVRLKHALEDKKRLTNEVEVLRRVRSSECDPRVKKLTDENAALRAELVEARQELDQLKSEESKRPVEGSGVLRLVNWARGNPST